MHHYLGDGVSSQTSVANMVVVSRQWNISYLPEPLPNAILFSELRQFDHLIILWVLMYLHGDGLSHFKFWYTKIKNWQGSLKDLRRIKLKGGIRA
ncbi:hypothetical protein V6N11_023247 [Hibiscus sabdariffa]|uniref:Uncharacterized protein n=1 Tax=Hibiscus sabdariffa TaxID=183260 RepID=A0ABR2TLZ4_9ROSI